MSLTAICQRCRIRANNWTITQATFHVGEVDHWSVRLCESCTDTVMSAVLAALQPPKNRLHWKSGASHEQA